MSLSQRKKKGGRKYVCAIGVLALLACLFVVRNFQTLLKSQGFQFNAYIQTIASSEQIKAINKFSESSKFQNSSNLYSNAWVTYIDGDGGDYIFGVLAHLIRIDNSF